MPCTSGCFPVHPAISRGLGIITIEEAAWTEKHIPATMTVHMKQGYRHQGDFIAVITVGHPVPDLQGVGNQVAVYGNNTFGDPGGTSAVLEQGYIVRADIQLRAIPRLVLLDQILHPDIALGRARL